MAKIDKERFLSLQKELLQDSDTQRDVLALINCSMLINGLKRNRTMLRDRLGNVTGWLAFNAKGDHKAAFCNPTTKPTTQTDYSAQIKL